MTKKQIRKITKEIVDNHEVLSKLNQKSEEATLSKYLGFHKTYFFKDGKHEVMVEQEVTVHHGYLKYIISYFEDGARIPHNISYIKKVHDWTYSLEERIHYYDYCLRRGISTKCPWTYYDLYA